MKFLPVVLLLLGCCNFLIAQPYFDAVVIKSTISPDAGLGRRNNLPVNYSQFVGGLSVPVVFKKDSSKLVFSAFTEYWDIAADDIAGNPGRFLSLIGAVTYIKPVSNKWTFAAAIVPRWNGNAKDVFNNSFQIGTAVLATYKRSSALSYRFGVYYNSEFFGTFIIPLVGLDWRLSSKDNLFGTLPQNLIYEHKVNDRFYWGANYRMYNNSYRIGYRDFTMNPNYMRIVEMQVTLTGDVHLTKNIVFNIEAGHSLFRKLRLGTDADKKEYYHDDAVNNGFLLKAGLMYRMRLR